VKYLLKAGIEKVILNKNVLDAAAATELNLLYDRLWGSRQLNQIGKNALGKLKLIFFQRKKVFSEMGDI